MSTYGWIRKGLGISCAGGIFALAGLALAFEIPQRFSEIGARSGVAICFTVSVCLVALSALYTLPFDILSHVTGRKFGRVRHGFRKFAASWSRGVGLQSILLPSFMVLIHCGGRVAGDVGAMTLFTVILVYMYLSRTELSRFIDGYQFRIFTFKSIGALKKGPERARLIVTILWNQAAFACALSVPGAGTETVGPLTVTIFAFTCFSLLGWLFLPWIGRRHDLARALLALDLSWAGGNLITRSVCTNVGIPRKWLACEAPNHA
jgi:hypothetical protein